MVSREQFQESEPDDKDAADWINLQVSRRLKTRRILRNMTQERLAKALGVSYQQLQRYESGKSKLPCSMIYRAAVALDVPITEFFGVPSPALAAQDDAGLDKLSLLMAQDLQNIPDASVRQSLMRLIGELARTAKAAE